MTADIKFACSHCEQNMLVEAEAAGLATDCPTCGTAVKIPETSSFEAGRAFPAPHNGRHLDGAEYAQAAIPTEGDLASSRRETARVREQLATVHSECERLNANSTHAQAEIKSFQTERLAAKADLTLLKQRVGFLESQISDKNRELAGMHAATAQLVADFDAARAELATLQQTATEAQESAVQWHGQFVESTESVRQLALERNDFSARLSTVEEQFCAALSERETIAEKLQQAEAELAQGRALLADSQEKQRGLEEQTSALRTALEEARRQLTAAEAEKARLVGLEAQLSTDLAARNQEAEGLLKKCGELDHELQSLRRSVDANDSGRELMAVRAQLAETEKERHWFKTATAQLEADLGKTETESRRLEAVARELRDRMETALVKAEAASEEQIKHDNEVLRGIIARQNAELEIRHRDIVRLKRARFGLKLVYALFALGLVGLGIFALQVLPGLQGSF